MENKSMKPRWNLLPWGPLKEVVLVFQQGLKGDRKPNDWQDIKHADARDIFGNAAMRHFTDWLNGERVDLDSGCSNLSCVAANILILMWHEARVLNGKVKFKKVDSGEQDNKAQYWIHFSDPSTSASLSKNKFIPKPGDGLRARCFQSMYDTVDWWVENDLEPKSKMRVISTHRTWEELKKHRDFGTTEELEPGCKVVLRSSDNTDHKRLVVQVEGKTVCKYDRKNYYAFKMYNTGAIVPIAPHLYDSIKKSGSGILNLPIPAHDKLVSGVSFYICPLWGSPGEQNLEVLIKGTKDSHGNRIFDVEVW